MYVVQMSKIVCKQTNKQQYEKKTQSFDDKSIRMWTKSNIEGFEKVDAGNYALFVESGKTS